MRKVRKASEQVVDELRQLISSGAISPGERLPKETVLAHEFGVSRATVREALRVLATMNLIRTTRGAGGGSYVTLPTVDHISTFLLANLNLLTASEDVSLADLLEARELLEVPAARLAARRKAEGDVPRLRGTIPRNAARLSTQEEFVFNKEFHSVVLEICRNPLLVVAAQPIFSVLQTHLARSSLGRRFHSAIHEHHTQIAAAIESGDEEGAAQEMHSHLTFLRPYYEKAWRDVGRQSGGH